MERTNAAEFSSWSRMMEVKVIEKDQSIPGATRGVKATCVGSDDGRL